MNGQSGTQALFSKLGPGKSWLRLCGVGASVVSGVVGMLVMRPAFRTVMWGVCMLIPLPGTHRVLVGVDMLSMRPWSDKVHVGGDVCALPTCLASTGSLVCCWCVLMVDGSAAQYLPGWCCGMSAVFVGVCCAPGLCTTAVAGVCCAPGSALQQYSNNCGGSQDRVVVVTCCN